MASAELETNVGDPDASSPSHARNIAGPELADSMSLAIFWVEVARYYGWLRATIYDVVSSIYLTGVFVARIVANTKLGYFGLLSDPSTKKP